VNIPNILTVVRFFLVPIFGYYLYQGAYLVAVCLFLLAGITDILDGYIARKLDMVTSWGKLADPLADKLMQITALVILTLQYLIPLIILIIFVAKESAMILGTVFLYKKRNVVVSANWYGKAATVIFYITVLSIIIAKATGIYTQFAGILIAVALISALYAFFMYTWQFARIRKECS